MRRYRFISHRPDAIVTAHGKWTTQVAWDIPGVRSALAPFDEREKGLPTARVWNSRPSPETGTRREE